jgi:nitrogenase molybdenum-iron protein NifN
MQAATHNPCKVCSPLGASLVFRGIEGAMPILHGSQGCSTYIRRYIISHFREPIDIASSNFSESAAVFGGRDNLFIALDNVIRQYHPSLIGIATTCLSETIGDDVPAILRDYRRQRPDCPPLVHVSTPSFKGTHMDGFHTAVRAVVEKLAEGPTTAGRGDHVNVFSGLLSPADLRYLREMLADAGIEGIFLPDYSSSLDGPAWDQYQVIPPGGTAVADLKRMGQAKLSIQMGSTVREKHSAAGLLKDRFGVPATRLHLPIGVKLTDAWWDALEQSHDVSIPTRHLEERGRLIDSYVDGHKYIFGAKAFIYGEEDMVAAMASFCCEVGISPVLCASGGNSGKLAGAIAEICGNSAAKVAVRAGADFEAIRQEAAGLGPDLLIGPSKGYSLARELGIPLIRVGFPIHDRFGSQRILHIGYRGAQQLFDRITCAIQDKRQESSEVGYAYL